MLMRISDLTETAAPPTSFRLRIRRVCTGLYKAEVIRWATNEVLASAEIERCEKREGWAENGWMARAEWTNGIYTDFLPSYADAKQQAIAMLHERIEQLVEGGRLSEADVSDRWSERQKRAVESLKTLPERHGEQYVMDEFKAEPVGRSVIVSRRYGPPFSPRFYFEVFIVGPRGAMKRNAIREGGP